MNHQILSTSNDLTVFVNTSDSFEDCWEPFFKLFKLYWPDCPHPIVLNTETKDYHYQGLHITCSKVSVGEKKRLGWSECLMRALDAIETPYILYLQEDYFLEAPVKADTLKSLLNEMVALKVGAVRLSGTDGVGPFHEIGSTLIVEVDKGAKWRLSLQAALWKKSLLRALIRKHETPWQLESYGSFRTRRFKEKICSVNREIFSVPGNEIFPYTPTGVIAGRWVQSIVEPLFVRHKINIDFSVRGFHVPGKRTKKRKSFLLRVVDRIRSLF
jgi:hypothetical protein